MIVSIDVKPDKNIYVMGAKIVAALRKSRFKVISLSSLYDQLNSSEETKISIDNLVLAIDWLYILGLVDADVSGDVRICF